MYETIIFDYFGVIETSRFDSWLGRHGYRRSGKFVEISNLTDAGRISMQQFFDGLSEMSGIPAEEIKTDFSTHSTLNTALIELIKALKKKYKIVLLSNASSHYLRSIIKKDGLDPYFDEIIVSGEIGLIKPDREIFEFALDKARALAEKTVFIDDRSVNVEAAEKLGITGLVFSDMHQLRADLAKLGIL